MAEGPNLTCLYECRHKDCPYITDPMKAPEELEQSELEILKKHLLDLHKGFPAIEGNEFGKAGLWKDHFRIIKSENVVDNMAQKLKQIEIDEEKRIRKERRRGKEERRNGRKNKQKQRSR